VYQDTHVPELIPQFTQPMTVVPVILKRSSEARMVSRIIGFGLINFQTRGAVASLTLRSIFDTVYVVLKVEVSKMDIFATQRSDARFRNLEKKGYCLMTWKHSAITVPPILGSLPLPYHVCDGILFHTLDGFIDGSTVFVLPDASHASTKAHSLLK
jgi:hypothetical protein